MKEQNLNLHVSGIQNFDGDLSVFTYDKHGNLLSQIPVKEGKAKLKISAKQALKGRVFIAPQLPEEEEPSLKIMERINAYEPVLKPGMRADIQEKIRIPGNIIDYWNICFCWVKGRVLKSPLNLPVCGARVHICEVDRLPRFIIELPERDIFRLRDDLLRELIERPRIPEPPRPLPDPPPFRAVSPSDIDAGRFGFNPQPEPPKALSKQQIKEAKLPSTVSTKLRTKLTSNSASIVRSALLNNIELIYPFLCLWPWWWWRLRCDEIRVLETDSSGRFETTLIYSCNGDKPDLYFWVEYNINGEWETVYKPPMACNTHWNYECGTDVTIRVNDDRVPACDQTPDLDELQVAVMSIGNNVSISEIQGPGVPDAQEGLTNGGAPFGGRLEPHVWFSRSNLIDAGIKKYRWSYKRLSGPDGVTADEDPTWTPMLRKVGRHYSVIDDDGELSFPFEKLGPDVGNLFRIQPIPTPAQESGLDPESTWEVRDAREDTASAFFETTKLPHGLPEDSTECEQAELTAGRYELKLELFKEQSDGSYALVDDWEAEGIDLKIADQLAPVGTDTDTTTDAPEYYKLDDNEDGNTEGFRMVVRVDNNCCEADILPISSVGGGLSVDVDCGFIEYEPGSVAKVSFFANHPNDFATFDFDTWRGLNSIPVPEARTAGKVGDSSSPSAGGTFTETSPFTYSRDIPVNTLLTSNTPASSDSCNRAAFTERLHVNAMATDGWRRLNNLDSTEHAAYALAEPCDCNGDDEES